MKSVHLLPLAQADLVQIADYIAERNHNRSISFVLEIRQKIEGLGHMSEAFPLWERGAHLGIRRRSHKRYLILYRPCADAQRVEVLRVLHSSRELQALQLVSEAIDDELQSSLIDAIADSDRRGALPFDQVVAELFEDVRRIRAAG